MRLTLPLGRLRAGEYVCLRVVQENGGAAWSSPWFVVEPDRGPPAP